MARLDSNGLRGLGKDRRRSLIAAYVDGKWGSLRDEERICHGKGVQLDPEWDVFFSFFFLSEVLVMNHGICSGN